MTTWPTPAGWLANLLRRRKRARRTVRPMAYPVNTRTYRSRRGAALVSLVIARRRRAAFRLTRPRAPRSSICRSPAVRPGQPSRGDPNQGQAERPKVGTAGSTRVHLNEPLVDTVCSHAFARRDNCRLRTMSATVETARKAVTAPARLAAWLDLTWWDETGLQIDCSNRSSPDGLGMVPSAELSASRDHRPTPASLEISS